MLVGLPNGVSCEDWTVNLSTKTVLTALIFAVAACTGTDAKKSTADVTDLTSTSYALPTASVNVAPQASAVRIGQTVRLVTSVIDSNGRRDGVADAMVRWTSSDTSVAIVSPRGIVTGRNNGTVTISAVAEDHSASSVVTVGTGKVADTTSIVTTAHADTATTAATATSPAVTTPTP